MNIDKVLELMPQVQELTKKLKAKWEELQIAMTGDLDTKNVSMGEHRRVNVELKDKIVAVFKESPNRGFTFRDIMDMFPDISGQSMSGRLKYLVKSKVIDKIGDGYRLHVDGKKVTKKPLPAQNKKFEINLSPEKALLIKDNVISLTKKHPKQANLSFFNNELSHDYYAIRRCVMELQRDGVLKENTFEGRTSDGAKRMMRRFAVV